MSSDYAHIPFSDRVSVLSADPSGLLAINKPAGIRTHPRAESEKASSSCLLQAKYDFEREGFYWDDAGSEQWLFLVNRLDSPTSGILLATQDEELAKEVRNQFIRSRVSKVYYAIVIGKPSKIDEVWEDYLKRKRRGEKLRVTPEAGGSLARLRAVLQKQDTNKQNLSLLKLLPRTGRTHQLRVQCAKRGLPILGDKTYGDFKKNRNFTKVTGIQRMFLHSAEVEVDMRWKGEPLKFRATCPLPPRFDEVLNFNRELQIEKPLLRSAEQSELSKIRKRLRRGHREVAPPPPPSSPADIEQ